MVSDGHNLWLEEVDAAGKKYFIVLEYSLLSVVIREQRWRVDGKGRMVHKASNKLLALVHVQRHGGQVEMKSFREADREVDLVLPA